MEKVRIGIVGLGGFAERHLAAWASLGDVEVAAACSRSRARVEEIGARFGIRRLYTDLDEMLAKAPITAVDVVTAAHQHAGPALAALDAGKHVLVETPMAIRLEDADRMLALASAKRLILTVDHVLRFDPRYVMARERIASGEAGKLGSIYSWRSHGQQYFSNYVVGAPLLGAMVHDVDLVLWYAGQKVQRLSAYGGRALGGPAADTLWAKLEFENGAIGVVQCSWLNPPGAPNHNDCGLEIRGARATIQVRDPDRGVSVWTQERAINPFGVTWGSAYGRLMGPLKEQLAYFAARVRGDALPEIQPPGEAREALQVSLAALNQLEEAGVPTGLRAGQ